MTADPTTRRPPSADSSPAADIGSPTVLLVDDNRAKRLALRAVLAPLGYPVVEADSGRAALRQIMLQDFAVILLDVCMPIMDGFETAAFIRQRRQSEMTPIIFITAYASDEILPTSRYVQGAVDFIFAPVQPDELRAKVSFFANQFTKASELAIAAREVQTSADQLRLLTEAAPIGIFQTDASNRYVYTNPRWSEITGIPAEVAAGQAWDSLIGAPEQPRPLTEEANSGPAEEELSHQFEIRRGDLPPRVGLVTARPIPSTDGGIAGWVGTLADVTAETGAAVALASARDQATEASQLKSDFLANMSHEIRTPMNGVIGMTALLLDTDLDATQRDYVETVQLSGEALMVIINDILDFSKVNAGDLTVEATGFDLRALVTQVVAPLTEMATANGVRLTTFVDDALPATITGDPGRIGQILNALLGNAVKFTPTGTIALAVSAADVDGPHLGLRFEIRDTGDGIPLDKVATIFQPFTQADTSTSRKYGGTGLGLALTQRLVTLLGGTCGVSSERGIGSTFWFTVAVSAQPPDQREASRPAASVAQ